MILYEVWAWITNVHICDSSIFRKTDYPIEAKFALYSGTDIILIRVLLFPKRIIESLKKIK